MGLDRFARDVDQAHIGLAFKSVDDSGAVEREADFSCRPGLGLGSLVAGRGSRVAGRGSRVDGEFRAKSGSGRALGRVPPPDAAFRAQIRPAVPIWRGIPHPERPESAWCL